jgi:ATP-binding cassette subfamily F protein uup
MKDIRVAFLDQDMTFDPKRTIFDEVYSRMGDLAPEIREYEEAVASGDSKRLERAITAMDASGTWDIEQNIRQVLTSLKLERLNQPMGELSGGEAKRVALACMMLQDAEFLIMDEPTNHLDIDIIEYLEGYLQRSRCTLLMVTHDRYFLDRVCNTIMEIDRGNLYTYRGNYTQYLEKREERYAIMQADIDKSRNLLRRELEWIRSTPQARTGKARYRVNAFYDLKDRASVSLQTGTVEIDVATSRLGRKIIDCTDVNLSFEGRKMLDNFSYKFTRGERIGIVGRNGVGKTTFLNLISGKISPDSGIIEQGETLRIGYYSQRGINFKPGQTVLECVQDIADIVKASDGHAISATTYLNRFLFPHDTFTKRIDILSGGEKRRLYLLTVLMQNPNMLILDEPTNDLDIMTLNVLEEYLQEFKGSLIIVSHDRYFLDKCADHLFVFEGDGHIKDFVGQYSEYREYIKEKEAIERNAERSTAPAKPQQQRTHDTSKRKLSYKEQRELEQIEKDLQSLGEERSHLETEISSGTLPYDRLAEVSKRIEEIIATIDEKEMRWLELNE